MGPFEEAAARVKALRREAGAVPAWAKAERLERSVPEKELCTYGAAFPRRYMRRLFRNREQ